MNQFEFQLCSAGPSQCARIARRLAMTPGQWVPMPELYQVSGAFAVHSRISDLRKRGLPIQHKNERHEHGLITSFYRLQTQTDAHPQHD